MSLKKWVAKQEKTIPLFSMSGRRHALNHNMLSHKRLQNSVWISGQKKPANPRKNKMVSDYQRVTRPPVAPSRLSDHQKHKTVEPLKLSRNRLIQLHLKSTEPLTASQYATPETPDLHSQGFPPTHDLLDTEKFPSIVLPSADVNSIAHWLSNFPEKQIRKLPRLVGDPEILGG